MGAIVKRDESELSSMDGLERVLIDGDLSGLNSAQRTHYYLKVCESTGLNPVTQPFEYLKLNGKTVLYAKRSCTDQLRSIHRVSVVIVAREKVDGLYIVTARATTPDGRTDESVGAVHVEGLKGENLANAIMKSETKAKRRVTLAICGLSMLDESELDGVSAARVEPVRTAIPAQTAPVKLVDHAQSEPSADPTQLPDDDSITPADEIRMLVEVDLNRCTSRESLITWAQCLLGVKAKDKLAAWKAFEAKAMLVDPKLSPKELVNAAKGAA